MSNIMKDLPQISDITLLSFMKGEDADAFHQIFLRYNKILFVHAYGKLRDKEEAKDVVQDVFAKLWQKREEIVVQNGQLAPYLYAAVRHRVLDIIAKKKVASQHIEDLYFYVKGFENYTDTAVRESLLAEIIKREIAFLPNRMRQIFVMSRYDHLSHKEIARELDIADSTVTDQVKKALKILRSKLNHLFYIVLFYYFF